MSAQALVTECRTWGISLRADGSELVIRGPLDADLKGRLRDHKHDLLRLLTADPTELHHCGGGVYHQLVPGGEWECSFCSPRVGTPTTVFVVPGGIIPGETI